MDKHLKDKVAFITGGFTGIGLAISREFVKHGASISIGSRHLNQSIVDELKSQSTKVLATELDIRNSHNVNDCVAQTEKILGPIDILVNAAGISASQSVSDHSDQLWDNIIETSPVRSV